MGPSTGGAERRLTRVETELEFYKVQLKEVCIQVADLEDRKNKFLGAQAILIILWPLILAGIMSYINNHRTSELTRPSSPVLTERLEKR